LFHLCYYTFHYFFVENLDLESEIGNPPTKITNFLQTSKIPFLNISDNNQGIEIPEDTQNNSAAPNIQTLSEIGIIIIDFQYYILVYH